MKTIAMYLPQFHKIPENDAWWGKGFTDWDAARNAHSLFEGHRQPRLPYDGNYYDLLEKKTMLWQEELLKKYSIDGLCIYHYWFENGRQILERPAENLLKWIDIQIPFCFCWANEPWVRSWSNVRGGNVWANTFEKGNAEDEDDGILLKQSYGEEKEWRKHFLYFLPFFRDERYLRIEEKPIIMIYLATQIHCLSEMLGKWQQWAIEEGFSGIYVIGRGLDQKTEPVVDAVYLQEPQNSFVTENYACEREQGIQIFDYKKIWDYALKNRKRSKKPVYYGGFVDYDDSPRRGNAAQILKGATPELFRRGMTAMMLKNHSFGSEITFVNAWNEWGEGMYLEPDEENGFAYLEAIKQARSDYEYLSKGIPAPRQNGIEDSADSRLLDDLERQSERRSRFMKILDRWLTLYEKNPRFLGDWVQIKEFDSVAIYGIGMLGMHLVTELKALDIEIAYGIDRFSDAIHAGFPMYTLNDSLPKADIVIVTVLDEYEMIKEKLNEKGLQTVSIESLTFELE